MSDDLKSLAEARLLKIKAAWSHVHHALFAVAILVAIVLAWRVSVSVMASMAEQRALAAAADTKNPATPVDTAPKIPTDRGWSGLGRNVGGSGKPWTLDEFNTAVTREVQRLQALDAQRGTPQRPPADVTKEAERHLFVPEWLPPTEADRVVFERRFTVELASSRPLADVEIPANARWGGHVGVFQSRDGGAAFGRWRPNPAPVVTFRQVLDVYAGFVAEQTLSGRDVGGLVGVGWYPVRFPRAHGYVRADAQGELFAGRWVGRGTIVGGKTWGGE